MIDDTSSRFAVGIATTKGRAAAKVTRLFRLGAIVIEDVLEDWKAELVMNAILYDLYRLFYRSCSRVRRIEEVRL